MKTRIVLLLLLAFVSLPLGAQTVTITTPETISATNITVNTVTITPAFVRLVFDYTTAGGVVKRSPEYVFVGSDIGSFLTALSAARSGETGGIGRRMNFRVVGWMADNSKFTDPNGATIAVSVSP